MKMTSAYANKLLRQLNEEKEFLLNQEENSCTYVYAADEEPLIPQYSYPQRCTPSRRCGRNGRCCAPWADACAECPVAACVG